MNAEKPPNALSADWRRLIGEAIAYWQQNERVADAARFYVASVGHRNEESALRLLREAIEDADREQTA